MLINSMILQLFLVLNLEKSEDLTVTLRLAMYMLLYYTMVLFLGILVSLTKRGILSCLLHLQGLLLRYGRLEQEAAFTLFKIDAQ